MTTFLFYMRQTKILLLLCRPLVGSQKEIVVQGDVLTPLISSLQVDTMGKECLEEAKYLYHYKDKVPPPLGLVDDLFTITTCGFKTIS